jgi:hypothetical protein
VDLDGNIIHLKSIGKPDLPGNDNNEVPASDEPEGAMNSLPGSSTEPNGGESQQKTHALVWQDHFTTVLAPFLDRERIQQIKDMYLQGCNPPRASDSGWAGRKPRPVIEENHVEEPITTSHEVKQSNEHPRKSTKSDFEGVDERKVVSQVPLLIYLICVL